MIVTARRRISYAAILAGLFVLWPIIAYVGGQGFTALVGLAALPVLFFARPKSVPLYAISFIAFVAWSILSTTWSPVGGGLFKGSLTEASFAVSSDAVRVALSALAMGAVVFAARHVSANAPKSLLVFRSVAAIQAGGAIVTVIAMGAILNTLAPVSDPVTEMPQNLMRNVNAFTLILPILLAWMWHQHENPYRIGFVILMLVSVWCAAEIGSDAAIMALVAMMVAMLVLWRFPQKGFSGLFAFTAGYILFAPILMSRIKDLMRATGIEFPMSFWSRGYAWEAVGERIQDAPLIGHGLEASKSWNETFGTDPAALQGIMEDSTSDWVWHAYQIIPGHPHNMPLEIWAETGFIGAALAALTCILISVRLYRLGPIPEIARYAGAGLFGATFVFFSFSYSMWNDAFWSSVALVIAAVILYGRQAVKS